MTVMVGVRSVCVCAVLVLLVEVRGLVGDG